VARLLVTGYGGFLGQSICRQLIAAGHKVRGLARNPYPSLAAIGVETITGDATRLEDCRRTMQGIEGVIHTAAIAGVWGARATFESINVDATRFLLQAAKESEVAAFVYCSSPSVTFDGLPQKGIDESVPYPKQWLCDYPRTKAVAESLVLASNNSSSILTCALRPHLIWGEGDPHLIPRLIARCQSGRLRCVGDGRNLIDTVHVDSAAHAHCLAVEALLQKKRNVAGRAFFITDGMPVGCWDWISQILLGAGLEPPNKRISVKAAYRVGYLLELAYHGLRIEHEPPMTRFVAAQLGVDHYFSIDSARKELGYQPISDRQAKFDAMIPWLRTLPE
jgi:2-alkyl-3-oxoalkanoate reductase